MITAFSARVARLEKTHDMGNPYTHLTDEELDARLVPITERIEAEAGMPLAEYAAALHGELDSGEELPAGWTEVQARSFAAHLRTYANGH